MKCANRIYSKNEFSMTIFCYETVINDVIKNSVKTVISVYHFVTELITNGLSLILSSVFIHRSYYTGICLSLTILAFDDKPFRTTCATIATAVTIQDKQYDKLKVNPQQANTMKMP